MEHDEHFFNAVERLAYSIDQLREVIMDNLTPNMAALAAAVQGAATAMVAGANSMLAAASYITNLAGDDAEAATLVGTLNAAAQAQTTSAAALNAAITNTGVLPVILPTATAQVIKGALTGLTLIFDGANLLTAPEVEIVPASGDTTGNGATAHTVINAGSVTVLSLDTPGSLYTQIPNVVFSGGAAAPPATGLVQATLGAVTLTAGAVSAVAIATPGANIPTVPNVVFTNAPGDTGSGATAHAVLTNGTLTGIVIDTGGFNYVTAPTASLQ